MHQPGKVTNPARGQLRANVLGSGTGFWEFNGIFSNSVIKTGVLRGAGWLVGCLFFYVDVIDGAQQCSVLQVISGDIDGIVHRHSCCAGSGCWFFSCYVGCCIKCLRFSQRAVYTYYFIPHKTHVRSIYHYR